MGDLQHSTLATGPAAPRAQGQWEGGVGGSQGPQHLLGSKTGRAALKLLELSKDIQSTSWPSQKSDGTKTQQVCRAFVL